MRKEGEKKRRKMFMTVGMVQKYGVGALTWSRK